MKHLGLYCWPIPLDLRGIDFWPWLPMHVPDLGDFQFCANDEGGPAVA